MNEINLTTHLRRIGIGLSRKCGGEFRWATFPLDGYPHPHNEFKTLANVKAHWKIEALKRIQEIEAAEEAWNSIANAESRSLLLKWARGEVFEIPRPLAQALGDSIKRDEKRWLEKVESCAEKYGCAGFSWLHEAVLAAATRDPSA